ncbi:GntR family transcriptional regulator [Roseibium sp.]|uniref:GntR family transcriptional regulator n=1 Tax=Roseibium sp. TaxID=1936156 RepID=UPI003B501A5E
MTKDDIFEILRMRICLLDYAPEARLNERDLAAEFGISRTPMRAVLQRLERDGLIESRHGQGTSVTSIDLKRMQDVYLVRMRLTDALADSEQLPISSDLEKELADLITACEAVCESRDKREFARINIRLNTIMHGLVKNDVLREINEKLFFESARFWFLLLDALDFEEQVTALSDEISMLRRAIALRDIRLAAEIHKSHLALVQSSIRQQSAYSGEIS